MGTPSPAGRVLVTGATGFVGQRLTRSLVKRGYAVRATGRNAAIGESLRSLGAEFVAADLTDPDVCGALVRDVDFVVHTAARTEPWGRKRDFVSANVDATRNILEAALAAGVNRVVHFSSPSVQSRMRDQLNLVEGDFPSGAFTSNYAATKWASELVAAEFIGRGLDVVVLRPKAVYGPGDTTIMPHLIEAIESGRIARLGRGPSFVQLTHVDDVVEATVLALHSPTPGVTFTVTNAEPVDIWTIISELSTRLEYPPVTRVIPRRFALTLAGLVEGAWSVLLPGRKPPVTRYALSTLAFSQTYDVTAATEGLGFTAKVSYEQGIAEVAQSLSPALTPPSTPVVVDVVNTGWVPTRGWVVGSSESRVELPCLVAVVRHPTRGLGLIDTGYAPRFNDATRRFPYSLYRRFTPAVIADGAAVVDQLTAAGVTADEVKWIVLTHLDPDHCAGLADFPNADVFTSASSLGTAACGGVRGLIAHRQLPGLLPRDFANRIEVVNLRVPPTPSPFETTLDLFGDDSLTLVSLPGHTPGHIGVLMRDAEDGPLLWCGDAYWTAAALEKKPRGRAHFLLAHHRKAQSATYRLLRRIRETNPSLRMVASHDPEVLDRFDIGLNPGGS